MADAAAEGPPLALTMGEPAGIGGEIGVKAWAERRRLDLPPFLLLDDPGRLAAAAKAAGVDLVLREIAAPAAAPGCFAEALPVLPVALARPAAPGRTDAANAAAVLDSIRRAVTLARAGQVAAVITNPIQKAVLMEAGFRHPGHTEFLAELCGNAGAPVMMLACPGLRTVPVTVHMPLARALACLTPELIVEQATITAASLRRDFAIPDPRLAVAGVNPHAGEQGRLGSEDIDIVRPAVERLRAQGIDAKGPLAADSMFHAAARTGYDAAICMYHDQALIPLKTIDFENGVNITLGLPIVRTSPDHGTALALAGTGRASPASLIAAIRTAAGMARRRAAA